MAISLCVPLKRRVSTDSVRPNERSLNQSLRNRYPTVAGTRTRAIELSKQAREKSSRLSSANYRISGSARILVPPRPQTEKRNAASSGPFPFDKQRGNEEGRAPDRRARRSAMNEILQFERRRTTPRFWQTSMSGLRDNNPRWVVRI